MPRRPVTTPSCSPATLCVRCYRHGFVIMSLTAMGVTEHLSKQFDAELEAIRSRVLEMGGLVESQIRRALDGFNSGDRATLDDVIATDHRVNAMEVALDGDCSQVIVKRQPAANDLRLIIAIIKTVTDLERIGDEAQKIARMAKNIHERGGALAPPVVEVRHAAERAISMLRRTLDAFARLDCNAAAEVIRADAGIDAEFGAILRQLITYMMEDPRTISTALEIVWVAKAIERIGDHAKNMAEYVIYIVKGTDVRHTRAGRSSARCRRAGPSRALWEPRYSSSRTSRRSRSSSPSTWSTSAMRCCAHRAPRKRRPPFGSRCPTCCCSTGCCRASRACRSPAACAPTRARAICRF